MQSVSPDQYSDTTRPRGAVEEVMAGVGQDGEVRPQDLEGTGGATENNGDQEGRTKNMFDAWRLPN